MFDNLQVNPPTTPAIGADSAEILPPGISPELKEALKTLASVFFEKYDKDGDGFITPGDDAPLPFLDANGDSKMSSDEFEYGVNFDFVDGLASGTADGFINLEEATNVELGFLDIDYDGLMSRQEYGYLMIGKQFIPGMTPPPDSK